MYLHQIPKYKERLFITFAFWWSRGVKSNDTVTLCYFCQCNVINCDVVFWWCDFFVQVIGFRRDFMSCDYLPCDFTSAIIYHMIICVPQPSHRGIWQKTGNKTILQLKKYLNVIKCSVIRSRYVYSMVNYDITSSSRRYCLGSCATFKRELKSCTLIAQDKLDQIVDLIRPRQTKIKAVQLTFPESAWTESIYFDSH
jgi:hypothetical protein